MRFRPFLMLAFLLVFVISQPWSGGLASAKVADVSESTGAVVAGPAPSLGSLQTNNNTTAPPSFAELVPIIIFVLAGVGIAIVIVAVGLWIAGRRRRGSGGEGAKPGDGEEGAKGENDEWGASWKD